MSGAGDGVVRRQQDRWRLVRCVAWLLCLLPALPPLRAMFEASMALLMLAMLPGLFAAGCLMPAWLPIRRRARLFTRCRPYALALLAAAVIAYGIWMLPIAIDLSRIAWPLGLARDLSAFVAGLATVIALRIAPWPLVLFFGGNMVWMALTFGMLFVDAQTRLCASYLLGDQRIAGVGLMAWAIGAGAWLLVWAARRVETAESAVLNKRLKKSVRLPIKAAKDKGPDKSPA